MLRPAVMVAIVCAACSGALAAEKNSSRAIDRLVFEGVRSFEADDIRQALTCDVHVVRAERFPADRAALLGAIERTVELGYRHSGFRAAKITASYDEGSDRITVRVDEGPRHRSGNVRVVGKDVLPQAIKDLLTTDAGDNEAVWCQGEPVPFDDLTSKEIRERIAESLARQGRFSPKFEMFIDAPPAQEQASLVVKIDDPGPRAEIGQIHVVGAKRDDQAAVVRHLGLASGQLLDSGLADAIAKRLLETGRYLTSEVEIIRSTTQPTDGRESFDLAIRVREYDAAPPLSQPLSAEEQAILRLSDWAQRWSAGELNEDLVITLTCGPDGARALLNDLGLSPPPPLERTIKHFTLRLVLSPREGTVLSLRVGDADERPIEEWVLASYRDRVLAGSLVRKAKLEVLHAGTWQARVSLKTKSRELGPEEDGDQPFALVFAASAGKVDRGKASLLQAAMSFHPASLLDLVQDKHGNSSVENGRLTISGPPGSKAVIDAASGRPFSIENDNPELDGRFVVATIRGALAAERDRIDEQVANAFCYDGANAWQSTLCLLIDERIAALKRRAAGDSIDASLPRCIAAWQALRKVSHAALNDAPHTDGKGAGTGFELPARDDFDFYQDLWGSDPEARRDAVGLVLGLYRPIVPKDGWLWPLGRDVLLMHAGAELPKAHFGALARWYDFGPVGTSLLAWLEIDDAPRLGLQRTSLETFRQEYRPLLSGDSELSKLVLSLADAARSLEEHELRALAGFVEREESRRALADALAQLRKDSQQPIAEAAAETLDRLWQDWLGPNLRAAFVAQILAEDRARTAAAPERPKPALQPAVSPLQEPLGRLEEIDRELRDAAKERPEE